MTALFDYPLNAALGRVVPKARIYEHAGADKPLRDRFVEQVDQIVWRFKLAPETLNLSATRSVPEIQVFEIALRTPTLDEDVLRGIDRAIPFPLIFELTHAGRRRAAAAFKRPHEVDSTKWVISGYFVTGWTPEQARRAPLPVALDLGGLYDRILTAMMAVPTQGDEDISRRIERMEAIRTKKREVERIRARLGREKQFNKRVAINAELRATQVELERLTRGSSAKAPVRD